MTALSAPAAQARPVPSRPTGMAYTAACLPVPRVGALRSGHTSSATGMASLRQRSPAESGLILSVAGFPGLKLDSERECACLSRSLSERELNLLGLAYLRAERLAGAPPPEQASALSEQIRQFERTARTHAELTGPVSLALQIVDCEERPLAYDPALREALSQHVIMRAGWLHDELNLGTGGALVCFDEPFLDALDSPFCPLERDEGFALLTRALAETPGPRGLCVAGTPDWADLLTLPADVIFFDAYEQSAALIHAAPAVCAYIERGGALGWGIVPNDAGALGQERAETLAQRMTSSVGFLTDAGGMAPEQILAAALVSTSGRLAHLPAEIAAHAVALCDAVAAQLRAHYGLST